MKKLLLTMFTACASMLASAQLQPAMESAQAVGLDYTAAVTEAATSDGYELRFCGAGNPSSWNVVGTADEVRVYIHVPAAVATQLAGNTLTRITFSCSLTEKKSGYIFVSEDLNADPVIKRELTINNVGNSSIKYQNGNFTTPYTIKAGQDFYYGFAVRSITNEDKPLSVGQGGGSYSGHVTMLKGGAVVEDYDVGEKGLSRAYLIAKTVGENKSLSEMIMLGAIGGGGTTLPIFGMFNDEMEVTVENIGEKDVTSLNYSYEFNGETRCTGNILVNIPSGETQDIKFPLSQVATGRGITALNITKVNGLDFTGLGTSATFLSLDGEGSYPRKFIMEEGTGTWCQYCPRGLYGIDWMVEHYPDTFIPIAVHTGDSYAPSTYTDIFSILGGSVPSSIYNRDPLMIIDPNLYNFEAAHKLYMKQAAPVKIEMTGELASGKKSIDVTATTTFGYSTDEADFNLAFIVLEDGLVDVQTNYYSGKNPDSYPEAGPWTGYSSAQPWVYNHIARGIYSFKGIAGSIPTKVQKGVANTFTYTVPLNNYEDINKVRIVAIVIDNPTGVVLNAEEMGAATDWSKAEELGADKCSVAGGKGAIDITGDYDSLQIYTVAGQPVGRTSGLQPGIYIVVVDGNATKVAVQ